MGQSQVTLVSSCRGESTEVGPRAVGPLLSGWQRSSMLSTSNLSLRSRALQESAPESAIYLRAFVSDLRVQGRCVYVLQRPEPGLEIYPNGAVAEIDQTERY
jgi:hypothetical protein